MSLSNVACVIALIIGAAFGIIGMFMSYNSGFPGFAVGGGLLFIVGGAFCFTNIKQ